MDLTEIVSSTSSWWKLIVPSAIFIYGTYRYFLDYRFNLPPGPMPFPYIGSIWVMIKETQLKGCMNKVFRKLSLKYGPIFTFYFGPARFIVLNDAKSIHSAIIEQGRTFSGRIELLLPGFEDLGAGIVIANGELWKRNRRFGLKAMRDFGMGKDMMVTKIHDEVPPLLDELEKLAQSGEPCFPRLRLANAVSNVICSMIFGKRYEDPNDPEFVDFIHKLDEILSKTQAGAITFFIPFLKHFFEASQVKDFRTFHRAICNKVKISIEEHRKDFDAESFRDFADLFIQAEHSGEDAMSLDDFGWIMTDMFAAGTETTSTALTWTFAYLGKHKDVQEKCQEAIDRVIKSDRLPTTADRSKLVYLDAVFQEIMRCVTITPLALFHSNLETHAKINGYDCPPYTAVIYNVRTLHFDPTYWKNPEQFNPDRWIGEDGKLLSHSSHFMPFGAGPRICMGEGLARVEYFIFLVAILQRFRIELKTDIDFDPSPPGFINTCPEYQVTIHAR